MEDNDSRPGPDPDGTRAEPTENDSTTDHSADQDSGLPLSRRATLASMVGIGGLGLTSTTASAAKVKTWKKDRDANGYDLSNLGTASASTVNAASVNADTLSDNGTGAINLGALVDADRNEVKQLGAVAMQQNKTKIVDFAGDNLSIDSNNVLNASLDSSWEDADSDGLLEPADSSVTGIELQHTPIEAGPVGAAVIGGADNTASENLAIALGGFDNTASGLRAVACGKGSIASGENAFAGGDDAKRPSKATGGNSFAFGNGAQATSGNAIALGSGATAEFTGTAVAIGFDATASEFSAMALGPDATADAEASLVWSDGSDGNFSATSGSTGPTGRSTVHMLANFGFRFATATDGSGDPTNGAKLTDATSGWSSFSTRTVKQDVSPIDTESVLEDVEELDICEWSYESAPDVEHVGPMAEDFADAFDVGESDEHIDSGDADGVALAAIQGLSEKLGEKEARVDGLETELDVKDARIDDQRDRIDRLEGTVERKDERIEELEAKNEAMHERLSAVEDRLSSLETGGSSSATADD